MENKTKVQLLEEEHKNRIELFKDFFKDKLKELREEKGYSQKTVAHKLGVAVSTYANWEQGRREPSIYDIWNLTKVFCVEANELFDFGDISAYKR